MENFWAGFEKQAGVMGGVGSVGRFLGNVTGARQLKAGFGQVAHQMKRGKLVSLGLGEMRVDPKIMSRVLGAEKNLRAGGLKALGTAAVAGGAAYGANKMLSSPQQPQQ